MTTSTFTICPQGPFSLRESALFGFGQRHEDSFDGVMRLAFCLDGGFGQSVGVALSQDSAGVHGTVSGSADVDAVRAQVARVLSLDHDAGGYVEVGRRDPVIRRLQLVAEGLRPPLFYSPYEAAAWLVLSARRPPTQMAALRQRLNAAHGASFDLAGRELAAFPTPQRLLEVQDWPGLTPEKISRLHGVARAALEGRLEAERLRRLGPEEAAVDAQRLVGIGPFGSSLIVIRATGFTDVLPVDEPKVLALIAQLYHLDGPPRGAELDAIAERWRPFRTWVSVLIRAASSRLLTPAA